MPQGLSRRQAAAAFTFLVEPRGGLALAILQAEDDGDAFSRRGALTEIHTLALQLLAATFGVPGAADSAVR